MRATRLCFLVLSGVLLLFATLAGIPATAQPGIAAQGGGAGEAPLAEDGFVWHDDGASGIAYPGDGSSPGRYSPTGEDIVVTRTGTGLYTITVSANNQAFIPTATAITAESNHCKIGSFIYPGTDINVRCYDTNGLLTDEEFTLRWTTTTEDATLFVAADGLFTCCGNNPWGAAASVAKTGVGSYEVTVPGGPNFEQGHVQVTAYGLDASHCNLGTVTGLTAQVSCFESDGDPIDSSFTFLRIGSNDDAYVWADDMSSTVAYTPNPAFSHNPQGTDPTSIRTAPGRYTVSIPDHLVGWGGSVAVTARSASPRKCTVVAFAAQTVTVSCTNPAGNPSNSEFNLLFTRFQICSGVPANIEIGNDMPTAGDDVIVGTAGADVIDGLAGNDIICGLDGSDDIRGDLGDDTIYGGEGDDQLRGREGNDTVYGGRGADFILGNDGADDIYGDQGADVIFGGSGDDFIRGGPGNDRIGGSGDNDELFGDEGRDNVAGGSGVDIISGGPDDDTINAGTGDDINVRGNGGNDTMSGNGGNDIVNGDGDNDIVRGGNGDDIVNGNAGDDQLFGNPGNDTCDGGSGTDTANVGNCETILNVP